MCNAWEKLTFSADTAELIGSSIDKIVAAWRSLHPQSRPGKTVVVPKPGAAAAAIQAYVPQTTTIVSKLGADASTPTPTVVSLTANILWTETSPVITLIEPSTDQQGGTRNVRIVLHRPDDLARTPLAGVPEVTVKFNPDGSLAEVPPRLKELILEKFTSVQSVKLVAADRTGDTTNAEKRRLEGAFKALKGEHVRMASRVEKDLTTAEPPLFEGGRFQDVLFITGTLRG